MLKHLTIQATMDMIQTLVAVAIVIHTLEIIVERKQYRAYGIYWYDTLNKSYRWTLQRWYVSLLHLVCEPSYYLCLIVLELVSALLLLSHLFVHLSGIFLALIFLIHLLSSLRERYGIDGARQMLSILLVCLLLFDLSSDPLVKLCCLLFISFQTLLSYATAGIVKAQSSTWQTGIAISNILLNERFRNETLAHILMERPRLSKVLCWSTIAFECLFALLVLGGIQTCIIALCAGVLFHLTIAFTMGLNSFLWSFLATYPAILFFTMTFQRIFISNGKLLP